MTVTCLQQLGNFPSINENNISFDLPIERKVIKVKKPIKRRIPTKQPIIEIVPIEQPVIPLYSDFEQKYILRIERALLRHSLKSRNLMVIIGRVKGNFHAQDKDESIIIEYLSRIGIDWQKIKDVARMQTYRRSNPICEHCLKRPSEHTHHRTPPRNGGKEIESNYMAVCIPCHASFHPELPAGFIS